MTSDCISDNIPSLMNILKKVIPILIHLYTCLPLKFWFRLKLEQSKWYKATCHLTSNYFQQYICNF